MIPLIFKPAYQEWVATSTLGLYVTIGNINSDIRRSLKNKCWVPVAYLPIVQFEDAAIFMGSSPPDCSINAPESHWILLSLSRSRERTWAIAKATSVTATASAMSTALVPINLRYSFLAFHNPGDPTAVPLRTYEAITGGIHALREEI